jgi:uncharacterized ParB-like nuclease family protein
MDRIGVEKLEGELETISLAKTNEGETILTVRLKLEARPGMQPVYDSLAGCRRVSLEAEPKKLTIVAKRAHCFPLTRAVMNSIDAVNSGSYTCSDVKSTRAFLSLA